MAELAEDQQLFAPGKRKKTTNKPNLKPKNPKTNEQSKLEGQMTFEGTWIRPGQTIFLK